MDHAVGHGAGTRSPTRRERERRPVGTSGRGDTQGRLVGRGHSGGVRRGRNARAVVDVAAVAGRGRVGARDGAGDRAGALTGSVQHRRVRTGDRVAQGVGDSPGERACRGPHRTRDRCGEDECAPGHEAYVVVGHRRHGGAACCPHRYSEQTQREPAGCDGNESDEGDEQSPQPHASLLAPDLAHHSRGVRPMEVLIEVEHARQGHVKSMSNRRSLPHGEDLGPSQVSAEAAGKAPTWRYALDSWRGNDQGRRGHGANPARPRPALPTRSGPGRRNVLSATDVRRSVRGGILPRARKRWCRPTIVAERKGPRSMHGCLRLSPDRVDTPPLTTRWRREQVHRSWAGGHGDDLRRDRRRAGTLLAATPVPEWIGDNRRSTLRGWPSGLDWTQSRASLDHRLGTGGGLLRGRIGLRTLPGARHL